MNFGYYLLTNKSCLKLCAVQLMFIGTRYRSCHVKQTGLIEQESSATARCAQYTGALP